MADGPQAGLDLVDALADEPSLRSYHLLPSVRADLLVKLGRPEEARIEFERAAALTSNDRERELSMERARAGGALREADRQRLEAAQDDRVAVARSLVAPGGLDHREPVEQLVEHARGPRPGRAARRDRSGSRHRSSSAGDTRDRRRSGRGRRTRAGRGWPAPSNVTTWSPACTGTPCMSRSSNTCDRRSAPGCPSGAAPRPRCRATTGRRAAVGARRDGRAARAARCRSGWSWSRSRRRTAG